MSEHGDLWPGPRRPHGAADEPQQPLAPDADPLGSGDDAPAPAGAVPDAEPAPDAHATPAGRRALIWSVVGVVVVAAVAATAYLLLRDDGSEGAPAPVPTVTTTLPAPTATAEPIDRGEGSALFAALPGVVRQYVLTSISPVAPAVPGGPLETYDLTYQGDLDDAAVTYTVHVEQFATPELAAAAAEAWGTPLAPASSTGEVLVGGAATGAYSLFGDDGSAAETGSAVWTNGTLVLQASGPALDIRNFYLAFGL